LIKKGYPGGSAENRLRYQIDKCRRCEACKNLVGLSCLVFPEMFRLSDEEWKTRTEITTDQLRQLVNRCNFCAVCPCSDMRAALLNAKNEYTRHFGLEFGARVLEKVERIGELGGKHPHLSNYLLKNRTARFWLTRAIGIHPDRRIPLFPMEGFPAWLRNRSEGGHANRANKGKVAYFAGCSARYFFPEVAVAAVQVLEHNGIEVMIPEQHCCGMPAMLEGDLQQALAYAGQNMTPLAEAVDNGYDIVCSCPTCGYMIKRIWRSGADMAQWSKELEKSNSEFTTVQKGHGMIGALSGTYSIKIRSSHLKRVARDGGAFSTLSPEKRLRISENTFDLGEYLLRLFRRGGLDTKLSPLKIKAAYYPPCHLREQRLGLPYQVLLSLIPGVSVEAVTGDTCCGNAGIMGLKKEFHPWSIRIGSRLMARLKSLNPELVATDCLSCRMQFNQLTPYEVVHPIQIIHRAYDLFGAASGRNPIGMSKNQMIGNIQKCWHLNKIQGQGER
jgi:glycerol-3-phosphate dehydrogenase subunit C